ncbi:hypothetical protein R6Q59_033575 [Mikania micrantha]
MLAGDVVWLGAFTLIPSKVYAYDDHDNDIGPGFIPDKTLFITFLQQLVSPVVLSEHPNQGLTGKLLISLPSMATELLNLKPVHNLVAFLTKSSDYPHYDEVIDTTSVHEIMVVWNKGEPPYPKYFDSTIPVRIRVEDQNSLNNRFKPDPLIKTKAVLKLDDDVMMNCKDLERAFKIWRENPQWLVGVEPSVEYVKQAWAIDTSKFSGVAISGNTQAHYQVRSKCLEKFTKMYGGVIDRKVEFRRRKDGWDM